MLNLCDKFNALSCKKASINDAFLHPNLRGDWYLVQVNSVPEKDIDAIVSDIHLNRSIQILNGGIVRYGNDEILDIDEIKSGLSDVINLLENKVYTFLLFDNKNKNLFKGQPLIFIVDPHMNRSQIPYHRHLNNGYFRFYSNRVDFEMKESFHFLDEENLNNHHVLNYQVIPESVCYIHDVKELDVSGYTPQEVAYATMVGYAFRNEIFIKYYEKFNDFFWLGPETPFPSFAQGHLLSVEQENECHCGSGLSYKECHFDVDFKDYIMRKPSKNIDVDRAKKMVVETQRHFTYQSNKLLDNIVKLVRSS